jgi:hypothetical protein
MTIVIIGIILAMIGIAASLYQITTHTPVTPEVVAHEYWWTTWPM